MSTHQEAFLKSMPPFGTKRRLLEELTLDEISAVDRPAQKGALVTIIKRDESATFDTFEEACAHFEKRGLSEIAAMSAVAREHPDLLAKYNAEPAPEVAKAEPGHTHDWSRTKDESRDHEFAFDAIAHGIHMRENVPKHIAMRLARQRNPKLFEMAYGNDRPKAFQDTRPFSRP
jgi:hypothetical protein